MELLIRKYSREEAIKRMNDPRYINCTPIEIGNTGYYKFVSDNIAMKVAREERKRINNKQRRSKFLKQQNGNGEYLGIGIQYNDINYQKDNSELNDMREAYREDY